jgi:outer membrane protein TolC
LTFETARDAALARLRLADAEVAAAQATVRTFLPASLQAAPLVTDEERSSLVERRAAGEPPALRAARTAVRAADARVDAETQAMLPRVSLVAGAELASPNARAFALDRATTVATWDVTLQLEWSLSSLSTGLARRDRAIAERDAVAARAEQLRRQLEAERTSAAAARASAEDRLAASDRAVATASKLAEVRRNELATGVATPLDVTHAESERVRAALEREDAALDLRLADARLAFAAGWIPDWSGD